MSNNESVFPFTLDEYFQSTPIGSIEKSIGNNFYGINHRLVPGMVPINKDSQGLTLFVRPQLNLQSDNVRNVRQLTTLLSTLETSVQRFVRATLDPRLNYGYGGISPAAPEAYSPFVDPLNAFIPVLTNNLNSISGWPDVILNSFISKAGLYQEEWGQTDSTIKQFSSFDLSATFRNTKGDPIIYMFYVWLWYQSMVFEGLMVPYPDFIVENRIDYNTRIYRLILDPEKRYVRKIAACGVAWPQTVPMGEFFDFSHEHPFNDQTKDFTIRFKCLGAIYNDDILVDQFNRTVSIFNTSMFDDVRPSTMVKIHPTLLNYFNNRGYPRINPDTYELEWWISNDLFKNRTTQLSKLITNDSGLSDIIAASSTSGNTGD